MIAKIIQGTDFGGVVNYVLNKKGAEILTTKGVIDFDKKEMAHSFEIQARLKQVAKPVAHISLNFSAQDNEKLTNEKMIEIAEEYIKQMGYDNTQVLMVRHNDREHPHVHLVLNRIDSDGNRISDKNERLRSMKICKELTEKHKLYIASGKENVKRDRLREPEKTKYMIYDSLVTNVKLSKSWKELQLGLKADGVDVSFKTRGGTLDIEGVRFTANDITFSGSKIDKRFSYSKINSALKQNRYAEQQVLELACNQESERNSVGVGFRVVLESYGVAQQPVVELDYWGRPKKKVKKKKRGIKR